MGPCLPRPISTLLASHVWPISCAHACLQYKWHFTYKFPLQLVHFPITENSRKFTTIPSGCSTEIQHLMKRFWYQHCMRPKAELLEHAPDMYGNAHCTISRINKNFRIKFSYQILTSLKSCVYSYIYFSIGFLLSDQEI